MPSPKSTPVQSAVGFPYVPSGRPVRKHPTLPMAIPTASGIANKSPVRVLTPRRPFHRDQTADKAADDRLSANPERLLAPITQQRRLLEKRQQAASKRRPDK